MQTFWIICVSALVVYLGYRIWAWRFMKHVDLAARIYVHRSRGASRSYVASHLGISEDTIKSYETRGEFFKLCVKRYAREKLELS